MGDKAEWHDTDEAMLQELLQRKEAAKHAKERPLRNVVDKIFHIGTDSDIIFGYLARNAADVIKALEPFL